MPRPRPSMYDQIEKHIPNKDDIISFPNESDFNLNKKFTFRCKNDHTYKLSITQIKRGKDPRICPHCTKQEKYNESRISFETVKKWADRNNYTIENKKDFYRRYDDTIRFICNNCNSIYEIRSIFYWEKNKFPNHKCICYEAKEQLKYKEINDNIKYENFSEPKITPMTLEKVPTRLANKIISQNRWNLIYYKNTKTKCKYQCKSCGYIKETLPHNLFSARGIGCPICKKIEDHKRVTESLKRLLNNSELAISDESFVFDHSYSNIPLICSKCHHKFVKKWSHLNQLEIYNCPKCYKDKKRGGQESVLKFLESIYNGEIIEEYSDLGFELDIFIPKKNLAIEYCGLYWHSTKFNNDSNRHYKKWKKCQENGIRLITLFEDEWITKREICESRIRNILGICKEYIGARNCDIVEITNKESLEFCSKNHIQGRGNSSYAVGLTYNGKLVSVMTFSKGTHVKNAQYEWELNRFCSLIGYRVQGAASKMLKNFEKKHRGEKLVSFCDMRWGTGKVYENSGFTFTKHTRPNYYYFGKETMWTRKHRYNFNKKILVEKYKGSKDQSEREITEEMHLWRIFDCGHRRYEKII